MKAKLKQLVIILFFGVNLCVAQKLTLSDLHLMSSNKNWETSNKYLLSKGWEFHNSEKGDSESYNTVTWSYGKSNYGTERATGWFYVFTFEGLPNKVLYRFRAKETYTAIRKQLAINGYKLQEEEILDNRAVATYSNANYVLEISYVREEDNENYNGSFTAYEVQVFKKGGVYDPNNGNKKEYGDDGNLTAEYALKDGKVNGVVKFYNTDGTIRKTTHVKMGIDSGLSTEYFYNENGVLIGKLKGELVDGLRSGKWLGNLVTEDGEVNISFTNYVLGIEEGDFKQVVEDSVVYGKYKNGKLDGKYDVFIDVKRKLLGGFIETDTLKIKKTSTGFFRNDKKEGHWKNYDWTGSLVEEGNFADSLKVGKWKHYYGKEFDESERETKYSSELYLIENYIDGQLNGESLRYSVIDEIEVPCKDSLADVCHKRVYRKLLERATYKNGVLHGLYELRNAQNELVFQGQFVDGKEDGVWLTRNRSITNDWKGENNETGKYVNGNKEGKWERRDDDNKLLETCHYKADVLHGEQLSFGNSNRATERRTFENGKMIALEILDNAENSICTYQISDDNATRYTCVKRERKPDGVYVIPYIVLKKSTDAIDPANFKIDFEALPNDSKTLDGYFEHKTLDDRMVEVGRYTSNHKVGVWSNYYYDQNVRTDFNYDGYGNVKEEYYYDFKKNEPFSGEFIHKTADGTEERKIKVGLRNGTTRYKDLTDKTVKKENYKEGILKE